MEKYQQNKNYQKTHEKRRLKKSVKKFMGLLAITAAGATYAHNSYASIENSYENHPKLEAIDTNGLVQKKPPLERLDIVSINGGTIELDPEESIRSTTGHYNFERGTDEHTAIATAKESLKIELSGNVFKSGNQIVVEEKNIRDAETGNPISFPSDKDSWVVIDNFDNDFEK